MIRMILVSVLTPAVAIGLVALLFFLPGQIELGVVIALAVGVLSTIRAVSDHAAQRNLGRRLTEAEDPELIGIVQRLCAVADIACPEVMLVARRQPNSWLVEYPRRAPRLYLTTALRELLTVDELTAVVGHELAHIANRDALVMSVVGTPSAVMRRSTAGGFGAIFVVAIGMLSELGIAALSRYRELAADAGSAAITGRPSALASALMKVSDGLAGVPAADLREAAALNAFNLVAVVPPTGSRRKRAYDRVLATHPPLQARLDALAALERAQQHG